MENRLQDRVVLVTGAARGQGRSHALMAAEEGADIIAVDVCETFATVAYDMATTEDLDETVALVEKLGRRAVPVVCDVRDRAALAERVGAAVAELGRLDAAVVNAGICVVTAADEISVEEWADVVGTDLTGAFNTAQVAIPHIDAGGRGGAMVFTGSATTIRPVPNMAHYIAAKHGVVGLARALARELAERRIRVNVVHPTNCDTPMIQNPAMWKLFAPDVTNPSREDVAPAFETMTALDTPWVFPEDVSRAVMFLLSDEARFTTGAELQVTAGYNVL
jgi:(+)-trans-carveol dehydrogenase